MKKHNRFFLIVAMLAQVCGAAVEARLDSDASVALDVLSLSLRCGLFTTNWSGADAKGPFRTFPDPEKGQPFTIQLKKETLMTGVSRLSPVSDGAVHISCTCTPVRDLALNSLYVSFRLPVDRARNAKWTADQRAGGFPKEYRPHSIFGGKVKTFGLSLEGKELRFVMDDPLSVLIQDDRRFGKDIFTVRFELRKQTLAKGVPCKIAFTLSSADGVHASYAKPIVLRPGKEWVPLHYTKNIRAGSALDFSSMGFCDAPAGKYGWLQVRNGHFVFEKKPEVSQRFYGVNFCGSACYPDPALAEDVAERLFRLGYNAVRIHHYDNPATEGAKPGEILNAERMAELDAYLAAFFKRGIYVTTDLFVSRRVPWRQVGIDRDGMIDMRVYKALAAVYEPAFQDLKRFTRALLTHVNPHTGRSYAQEPGLPLLSLINENNIAWSWNETCETDWMKAAWRAWVVEKRAKDPAFQDVSEDPPDSSNDGKQGALCALFFADTEARLMSRMTAFLRDELHCRALLTDQNCGGSTPMQAVRQQLFGYVDDHFYVDHPFFLEKRWTLPSRCGNKNPLKEKTMPMCGKAFTRIADKPFTITEFNFSAPGMYRGVGGILTGAMAALQDWDGLWRFAYTHEKKNLYGDSVRSLSYFDLASDPLSQATDRAAICLYLRGDLAPLPNACTILMSGADLRKRTNVLQNTSPRWSKEAWNTRIGVRVDAVPSAEMGLTLSYAEAYGPSAVQTVPERLAAGIVPREGGLSLDSARGSFTVSTPRTCGGFVEEGSFRAGPLAVRIAGASATVWVSSLDKEPITRSGRLLLTHVTDVQQNGITYAELPRRTLLKWGGTPLLARAGTAEICLRLDSPEACSVYALATTGDRLEKMVTDFSGDTLRFTASVATGKDGARMLYEVVREK